MGAKICTYYSVAEHIFAVESNDDILASLLSNYEPFKVSLLSPKIDDKDVIFLLQIDFDGLIGKERQQAYSHIFTDSAEIDMPRVEVYNKGVEDDSWLIRVSQVAQSPICCELESDKNFTKAILHIAPEYQDLRFCVDNALMLMYAFRTASMMTLEMHAAVVVRGAGLDGQMANDEERNGYLFLGHSGTGKSTHARLWLSAFSDAWLLNDDNPILRVMDDGEVRVYGSPWSGKTPCYKQSYARVRGIIKLSQAPCNMIHQVSLPEAYAYMLSSASGLKMDRQMADCMYESIKHIITHVKCYHMECLPNVDAAEVCYKGVK